MTATDDHDDARLRALQALCILDTSEEQVYDDLTQLAKQLLDTPIALISLLDHDRLWFKSRIGMQLAQIPLEYAFCCQACDQPGEVLVVPDASRDERFANNALVVGAPYIRFYVGAPLLMSDGHALGTLCALDTRPRQPTTAQIDELAFLARQVVALLEARRGNADAAPPP